MSSSVLEKVCLADNLPSLPTVAVEVLQMMRDESFSVDDLVRVIQNDPALTAKILKVVNSPMFGMPRDIVSVKQAMVILGMRTVKVMVLSFSLVDAFQDGTGDSTFSYETFWRRSLTCAVASRLLGKAISRYAEEAFVAGLLSDIGMISAWRTVPDQYAGILKAAAESHAPLTDCEVKTLGVSHPAMGSAILRQWNLPETLCDAVGSHHGEGLDQLPDESRTLAAIVNAAAEIASVFCQDVASQNLESVKSNCRSLTGIDDADLEEALKALDQYVCEAADMLSLQVGEVVDYAHIQSEAAMQLAQLSFQAEVDRAQATKREEEARLEAARLNKEKQAIIDLASTDSLTQIPNRAAFDKRLNEEIEGAMCNGQGVGLIMLDIDHFKQFNDTYGHQAGDEVLRAVASSLREVAQGCGFVARYGGEEFAAIMPNRSLEDVQSKAEEFRNAIENRVVCYNGVQLKVTASFGVVCINMEGAKTTQQQIVQQADELLYLAKRKGRNRVETTS